MRFPTAVNDGNGGNLFELREEYQVKEKSVATMLSVLHGECRLEKTGRLTNRHPLVFMSFEDRCIDFQLILANIVELTYANVRTFELCKALDHCESYTIAYIR